MDFEEYAAKFRKNSFSNRVDFVGVVEDNADNLQLGRVRVRVFGVHPEDRTLVPTEHLPWAIVAQPTTSASISGIGWSPNGLELGSWVLGFFADGNDAQYPIVTHALPGIHRPNPPGVPGGVSAGYLTPEPYETGGSGPQPQLQRPYHNEVVESQPSQGGGFPSPSTSGSTSGSSSGGSVPQSQPDQGGGEPVLAPAPNSTAYGNNAELGQGAGSIYLTLEDKDRWASLGLPTYDWHPCPQGYACKDGKNSLRFHYATALAFEAVTKEYGKGKMYLNSAYRTPTYNAAQPGAAKHSQHMQGRALDVSLNTIGSDHASIAKFAQIAVKHGFTGFGLYSGWLHIDTGNGRVWLKATEPWFLSAIKQAGWYPGKKGLSDTKTNPGAAPNATDAKNQKDASGSTSGLNNLAPGSSASKVASLMKAKGYNDAQIAAFLGNSQAESGINSNRLNPNDRGSPSYGLIQWRGDRYTGLINYSRQNNLDYTTPEAQVAYFDYEVHTGKIPGSSAYLNATNPYDANKAFASYEAYAGYNNPSGSEFNNRLALTNGYYNGTQFSSPADTSSKGFVDPTNSLPFPDYRGNPSTHVNARGFNSNLDQANLFAKDNGRMTGIPAAGDVGTFGEPELAAAPQYPYNHTYATKSGHILEYDDTPGSERINIEHKTGTGIEMFSDGSMVERTKGNRFETDFSDSYHGILGKHFLSSVNDMHIRSTADMTQQSDGSFKIIIGNDGHISISGDYVLAVGEDIKIRSGKRCVIECDGFDLISTADVNIQAKGTINLKAGKDINYEADGKVYGKATTHYLDDVVRVGEGEAKGNNGADTADVGMPPKRTVISKDNFKTTTNMTKVTTTEEAAGFYAGNGS